MPTLSLKSPSGTYWKAEGRAYIAASICLRPRPRPRFGGLATNSVCYRGWIELDSGSAPLTEGISWIRMLTLSLRRLPLETLYSCSDSVSDSIDGGNCLRGLPLPLRKGWFASSESRCEFTATLAECDRLDSSEEAGTFLTLDL